MNALDAVRLAWDRVPDGEPRRETAWRLLRELLPGARLSNPCPFCGGPHGPVRVSGVPAVASVTYAGGFALVAVAEATAATALGIDAEGQSPLRSSSERTPRSSSEQSPRSSSKQSPRSSSEPNPRSSSMQSPPSLTEQSPRSSSKQSPRSLSERSETKRRHHDPSLDRVLRPGATVRDWTRVEAVLKADGRGLRVDPALVRVEPGVGGEWTASLAGSDFVGSDLDGPPGLLIAVALRIENPGSVRAAGGVGEPPSDVRKPLRRS